MSEYTMTYADPPDISYPEPTAPADANPKDAAARSKPNQACAPATAAYWWGYVHEQGAFKYAAFNWRRAPVKASVYVEAARRHLELLAAGEVNDPDSGAPHAAHVMASMAILIDAYYHNTLVDDLGARPAPLHKVFNEIADVRARAGLPAQDPLARRQDRGEDDA